MVEIPARSAEAALSLLSGPVEDAEKRGLRLGGRRSRSVTVSSPLRRSRAGFGPQELVESEHELTLNGRAATKHRVNERIDCQQRPPELAVKVRVRNQLRAFLGLE